MLIGLDPSFSRTGISVYNDGVVTITCRGLDVMKDKSFVEMFRRIDLLTDEIVSVIGNHYLLEDIEVISETPPPVGQFASGLWALDSVLFQKFKRMGIETVYCIPPNYVGHVHGKRSYLKSESVVLAKAMIDAIGNGVAVVINPDHPKMKGMNHDEAESFILLCRLFVKKGMFVEELREWKGLFSEKEKPLGG